MLPFRHLHVHTVYSTLDGFCHIDELIETAIAYGMDSIAVTEHRNCNSFVKAYLEAKKWRRCTCGKWSKESVCSDCGQSLENARHFKVIFGCEIEETEDMYLHSRAERKEKGYDNYHLILLARNEEGYHNLIKIVSLGATDGYFDKKEAVDMSVLSQYGRGIIALSACLGGRVQRLLQQGLYEQAKLWALKFQETFDEFYLELQASTVPEQVKINQELVRLSRDTGIPLVITKDVHYVFPEDAEHHDTFICIQTGARKNDPDRFRFPTNDFYLASQEEMNEYVSAYGLPPEALENTYLIAQKCNYEIPLQQNLMPSFMVPDGFAQETYLRDLCYSSLLDMYERGQISDLDTYLDRLEMELDVICSKGYAGYFLILWDIIRFCRENNILTGPGRGSAAGSLVAYLLHITRIDPIANGLLFERFLNPERASLPDIDTDVAFDKRHLVIQYLLDKYKHVAQIGTFNTLGVKSGLRDAMRVYGFSIADINQITAVMPDKMPDQSEVTLEKLLSVDEEKGERRLVTAKKMLLELQQSHPEVIEFVRRAEGAVRATGIHAAGIIIAPSPITDHIPLMASSSTAVLHVSAFDMDDIDKLGLLKMDILGLKTLTIIADTVNLIKQRHNIDLDIYSIPLDDPAVFKLYQEGHTHAVFQLSGSGITDYTMRVAPSSFSELVDILALYRPGPLDARMESGLTMAEQYIESKRRPDRVTYLHPVLEPILAPTRGVLIYQEQVMRIVQDVAGYTLGQADMFRRAIGKKKIEELKQLRSDFVAGGLKRGFDEDFLNLLFDQIEAFAGYGFNKSHSCAYADLSYRTAYLKCYYPVEFIASQLTNDVHDRDKLIADISECRRLGITILPPDVNRSDAGFTVEGDFSIRFGLLSILEVGEGAVAEIVAKRPYESLADFVAKVDGKKVNKKVMKALIMAGVFDSFEPNRYKVLNEYFFTIRKFKVSDDPNAKGNKAVQYDESKWNDKVRLALEKMTLGIYISGHPLQDLPFIPWNEVFPHQTVELGCVIDKVKVVKDRRGNEMAFLTVETQDSKIDVTVFASVYEKYKERIKKNAIVILRGYKDSTRDQFVAEDILVQKKRRVKMKPEKQVLRHIMPVRDVDPLIEKLSQKPKQAPA